MCKQIQNWCVIFTKFSISVCLRGLYRTTSLRFCFPCKEIISTITIYLPSANEVAESNVFTSVCQEFFPQGERCTPPRQTHSRADISGRQTPPQADTTSWADTRPPWAATPPPPEIATGADGTHPTGMHSCLL